MLWSVHGLAMGILRARGGSSAEILFSQARQ